MPSSIEALGRRLRGSLIRLDSAEYDGARRVWNGMIDRRPAAIARCADTADVVACVNFARDEGVLLAVRGGGHNIAGNGVCDDGLVIDLSPMRSVVVDVARRRASAQGGALWGDFDRATGAAGLASTGGEISTTGIAGLTLGGGLGWLMGRCGLACDNLVQAEVVCADGRIVVAGDNDDAELMWGLQGGGGNFGVVTRFDYRLHEVREVLAGMILYPMSRARDVLRCYRDCTASAPDELTVMALLVTTPDGLPAAGVIVCHSGDFQEGERLARPLRSLGGALADTVAPMRYVDLQTMLDPTAPAGRLNYWKASFVPTLDDAVIEVLVEHSAAIPSPLSSILIEHPHGAVCRVGAADTAFGMRAPQYSIGIFSMWEEGESDVHLRWTRAAHKALQRFSSNRAYVNYLGLDATPQLKASYGDNYDRLVEVKTRYDPDNLFRVNFNIPPRQE
jgi:FAD/FMN-containing dehydrogenase